jgi:hypothetical protein
MIDVNENILLDRSLNLRSSFVQFSLIPLKQRGLNEGSSKDGKMMPASLRTYLPFLLILKSFMSSDFLLGLIGLMAQISHKKSPDFRAFLTTFMWK